MWVQKSGSAADLRAAIATLFRIPSESCGGYAPANFPSPPILFSQLAAFPSGSVFECPRNRMGKATFFKAVPQGSNASRWKINPTVPADPRHRPSDCWSQLG